jgi:hypothetical protein
MPSPVDLPAVFLTALLNPAVILVAAWMGARADQWQKVPIAAFAGALAGLALLYMAVRLGVPGVVGTARAAGGVFAAQFAFGLLWAALAYRFLRRRRP